MTKDETDAAVEKAADELRIPFGARRAALRNFPLSIVITDHSLEDNPIVYVNRAFTEMTGYSASEALGRNCRFLQGDDRNQEGVRRLRQAIDLWEEASVEVVNYRADGERFVNRVMVTPLGEPDGAVHFFLGIQIEDREAKSFADKASDLSERLREFQHRVKNHLSMILSMIRLHAQEQDEAESRVDILATRVEALSLLYEQVLNPSAPEDDQRVSLGAYLSRVSAALQMLAHNKQIRVNASVEKLTVPFDDALRFGLILSEVLTNALQHAFSVEERGEINVSVQQSDGRIDLTVVDNGSGLGVKTWPDTDNLGGKIVMELTRRLGGELTVSEGPDGKGTMVRLIA